MDTQTGKYIIIIGSVILVVGIIICFFGANFKWLGHLPGDIRIERRNFSFYFPITTLIILNLLVFLIFKVWRWVN